VLSSLNRVISCLEDLLELRVNIEILGNCANCLSDFLELSLIKCSSLNTTDLCNRVVDNFPRSCFPVSNVEGVFFRSHVSSKQSLFVGVLLIGDFLLCDGSIFQQLIGVLLVNRDHLIDFLVHHGLSKSRFI